MEPKNNSTTKLIVIFALGLAAGFAASQTLLSDRPDDDKTNDRSREIASTTDKGSLDSDVPIPSVPGDSARVDTREDIGTVVPSSEALSGPSAITIESQPAGSMVEVKRLVLGERSWVVVHEDERGRPGKIIGAGRFMAGTHRDVSVELLRGTESGGIYYGMIHIDDGDEQFDPKLDTHLPDESGSPLMVRFSAL